MELLNRIKIVALLHAKKCIHKKLLKYLAKDSERVSFLLPCSICNSNVWIILTAISMKRSSRSNNPLSFDIHYSLFDIRNLFLIIRDKSWSVRSGSLKIYSLQNFSWLTKNISVAVLVFFNNPTDNAEKDSFYFNRLGLSGPSLVHSRPISSTERGTSTVGTW